MEGYAFARNPIVIKDDTAWSVPEESGPVGSFNVWIDSREIYEGRFIPPLDIDISELVRSAIPDIPSAPESIPEGIVCIENQAALARRTVLAEFTFDETSKYVSFIALPGGVPKAEWRRYRQEDSDPFTGRYLRDDSNFFFHTGGTRRRLRIRETELIPLFFLLDAQVSTIEVKCKVTDAVFRRTKLSEGLYAMDLRQIRRWFALNEQVWPSYFEIYRNGVRSCEIVIEEAAPAVESYLLEYTNSLGFPERIEITGHMEVRHQFPDSEENTYSRFDPQVRDFVSVRPRSMRNMVFEIDSGFKSPEDMQRLIDMLASEHVRLIGFSPSPLEVIPSSEDIVTAVRAVSPESISLKLEVSEMDECILPDNRDSGNSDGGIFTVEFDKTFV